MHRVLVRCCLGFLISCVVITGLSWAQSTGLSSGEFNELVQREKSAHLGEILPEGIELDMDGAGVVDIRQHLHGPLIVFKVNLDDINRKLLDAIRATGGHSLDDTKARIAVIVVRNKTHTPVDFPESIPVFRTESDMETGFFGGHFLPTSFYFDQDLKLIKRSPGMPPDPNEMLHFPVQ